MVVHHMVALPFRQTLAGWRNGPTNAKSSARGGITPGTRTGWVLESSSAEKVLVGTGLNVSQQCAPWGKEDHRSPGLL